MLFEVAICTAYYLVCLTHASSQTICDAIPCNSTELGGMGATSSRHKATMTIANMNRELESSVMQQLGKCTARRGFSVSCSLNSVSHGEWV